MNSPFLPSITIPSTKGLLHEPKLTWDQVNEIRRRYVPHSRTFGLKSLSEEYGVSINNIHKIVRGQTWRVSKGDENVPPPFVELRTSQQISKAFSRLAESCDGLLVEQRRMHQT